MKRKLLVASLSAASMFIGLAIHFARVDADDKPAVPEKSGPMDVVQTTTLRTGDISQSITAYGSVVAQPGEVVVFSVPYECRVRRILVIAGQPIDKSGSLIDIEPSPQARLALEEANNTLDAATKEAAQTKERFDMKLATGAELLESQQSLQLAHMRLDSLNQQSFGEEHHVVTAESTGLVAKVDVQQGQIVPAGSPLVESIARQQLEVRLGIEPSLVGRLSIGQAVQFFPAGTASADAAQGKIHLITQRVNPDTRLVDVIVTPDSRDGLLLDGFVTAHILIDTKAAMIVPREAVLSDDDGLTLFTVKDDKAVKHTVTTAAQNDKEVAVVASDLHAGDTIVVEGNLELEDGMAVTTEEPK